MKFLNFKETNNIFEDIQMAIDKYLNYKYELINCLEKSIFINGYLILTKQLSVENKEINLEDKNFKINITPNEPPREVTKIRLNIDNLKEKMISNYGEENNINTITLIIYNDETSLEEPIEVEQLNCWQIIELIDICNNGRFNIID